MLQTSLLLMKSLNKTDTPIFLSVVCSLFPKAIFLTFILLLCLVDSYHHSEHPVLSVGTDCHLFFLWLFNSFTATGDNDRLLQTA